MSEQLFRINGDVTLVSGASRGIGRACLHALAAAGATVVGTATTGEGATRIGAELAAPALAHCANHPTCQ